MRSHWLAPLWVVCVLFATACGEPGAPTTVLDVTIPLDGTDGASTDALAGTDAAGPDGVETDAKAGTDAALSPDADTSPETDTATATDAGAATDAVADADSAAGTDALAATDATTATDGAATTDAASGPDTSGGDTDAVSAEIPPECTTPGDCNDGIACSDDACKDGTCVHVPNHAQCDDGNPCTDDSCDLAADCTNTANTLPCDDGNDCSADDACKAGTCAGNKVACPGTVCGNNLVEKGETCDLGGVQSTCCTSCEQQPGLANEVEPNNLGNPNSVKSSLLASLGVVHELCGPPATAILSPNWNDPAPDVDFFKVYVTVAGTLSVQTSDPTGNNLCEEALTPDNKKYLPLQTQVTVMSVNGSSVADLGFGGKQSQSNGCSSFKVDVAAPGWVYFAVQGSGRSVDQQWIDATYALSATLTPWTCGDGVRKGSEACEGTDLGSATCQSVGYTGGSLSCLDNCTFNTSLCTGTTPGVEPNESTETATPMPGDVVAGRFIGGADYYKIEVPQGATVQAWTTDPSGKNGCGKATIDYWDTDLETKLALLGPDGTELAFNDDVNKLYPPYPEGTNHCSALSVSIATAGTYYLKVTGSGYLKQDGGAPWGYELHVTTTPWSCEETAALPCESDDNHAPATATAIQSAVQGIAHDDAGDFYTFTVTDAATAIRLQLRGAEPGLCGSDVLPAVFDVYGSDGTTLIGSSSGDSESGCPQLDLTLDAGTYVVRVRSEVPSLAFAYHFFVSRGTAVFVSAALGATVSLPSWAAAAGASVAIPPYALYEDVTITVYDGTPIDEAGFDAAGPAVQFGPSGLGFVSPVTVSLPTSATDTASMVVLHRDDASQSVAPLEVLTPGVPGFASAQTLSFSTFQTALAITPILLWPSNTMEENASNNGQFDPMVVKIIGGSFAPLVGNGQQTYYGTIVNGLYLGYCDLQAQQIPNVAFTWLSPTSLQLVANNVDPYHGSNLNVGPFKCQLYEELPDGKGGMVSAFVDAKGNPVAKGKMTTLTRTPMYAKYLDPPKVTLSGTVLSQSKLGDGTIANKILVTIAGDKLKAPAGSLLSATVPTVMADRFSAEFTGSGLTPKAKVLSATELEISLEGMKKPPIFLSGSTSLTLTLAQADFKGLGLPYIQKYDLTVDWSVRNLHWSRMVFHENADLNDGSVVTESILTLGNDTFTAAPGSKIGSVSGLPAGLTGTITVDTSTSATLRIEGKATDPVDGDWNDWTLNGAVSSTFSVSFADSDFSAGTASEVLNGNRSDLELVMVRYPGFVYTGLPGGSHTELEAYDFGAGNRYLYWQPMLAEGGLIEATTGLNPCKAGGGICAVKNFGPEDRLAFKLTAGANPHGAVQSGSPTGCADDGAGTQTYANCTANKWYPVQTRTQLRAIGAAQAIVYNTTRHWQDFSANGEKPSGDPDLMGEWTTGTDEFELVGSCAYNEVCCGFASPYWLQHDIGTGTANYSGPFGFWLPDPIDFYAPWDPISSWGWDTQNHPLIGGPTDKVILEWKGGNGMALMIQQEITCPDVRLVNGKRVDLCEGAGAQSDGPFLAHETIMGFPLSWTTDCDGPWGIATTKCKPKYSKITDHGSCYGQPTGSPTGGNYPSFY